MRSLWLHSCHYDCLLSFSLSWFQVPQLPTPLPKDSDSVIVFGCRLVVVVVGKRVGTLLMFGLQLTLRTFVSLRCEPEEIVRVRGRL